MSAPLLGIILTLLFVGLEAVQFVYFGGLFQNVNPFFFGAMVFSVTVLLLWGWAAAFCRPELTAARRNLPLVIRVNLAAAAASGAYLASVALVEPAVVYTVSAGAMPLVMWALHHYGTPEAEAPRNRMETIGCVLLLISIAYLCIITIIGLSGFVRGGLRAGVGGIVLALIDGTAFALVLIYSKRLGVLGISAGVILGLRMILYVIIAAAVSAAVVDKTEMMSSSELATMLAIGLIVTLPPLYAFQKAVTLISALTLSVLTTLGPFAIFGLQILEGRVEYSNATLLGLCIYSAGALLAAWGAMSGTRIRRE
ncbi:MAG: hypothetical protein AAF441_12120 [Pseudomonadota bacterium]